MPSQGPVDIFPEGVTPDPVAPHTIDREADVATGPEPIELDSRVTADPVEPVEWAGRETAGSPEPVEWVERDATPGPEPIEYDTGRTNVRSPDPIEWVNRQEALPELPAIEIQERAPFIDRSTLRFSDGGTTLDTYWSA